MSSLPASILPVLLAFARLFSRPTWEHVQRLVAGTLPAQGPRTITAALRVMGLSGARRFERYHRVLNRARWSGLKGAQILLGLLIQLFAFPEPVPAGRRGAKPKQGQALAKLATRVEEARTQGETVRVPWYGQPKALRLLSDLCLWHSAG